MKCLATFACLVICSVALASPPTPLPIGQTAPDWSDLPGADGKKYSLADFKDRKGLVIIFFANHCPDSQNYLQRIIDLNADYQAREVSVVLVSVSPKQEDDLDHMKSLANEKSLAFPYLQDRTQKIGRDLGASATPEVFLFDGGLRLAYHGALDDHWKAAKAKTHFARKALDALLRGEKPTIEQTEPVGCFIEYEGEN